MTDDPFSNLTSSRRAFIKRLVALGFAAPVVTSFALDGISVAEAKEQSVGNQTFGNGGGHNFGNGGGRDHDHDHDKDRDKDRHRKPKKDDDDRKDRDDWRHKHVFPNQFRFGNMTWDDPFKGWEI
jgi:ABC-type Zn2+ transport system substrate-binding protein/surface adhesin